MRVAIITESFPPDVNGVAHCVPRVAELLTSYGHHPLVIAPRPPREWSEENREPRGGKERERGGGERGTGSKETGTEKGAHATTGRLR